MSWRSWFESPARFGCYCTVKAPASVLVVPIGVVAVTFLAVRPVPFVIAQLALMVVAVVLVTVQSTPPPETVTTVAPVRLVPFSVTGTVVLRVPVAGLIEASVAPSTVNAPGRSAAVPIGVVAVTFRALSVALAAITQFALIVVEVDVVTAQVTPVPDTVTPVAPIRLVPVRVTGTVVPRTPVFGAIEASVGPCTVNVTALLGPAGVVMVTFLAEIVAVDVIRKLAVT